MVDKNLTSTQIKFLTYLVWGLLTFLTIATAWTMLELYNLPKNYVLLERYQCDQESLKMGIEKLDRKLDRLIERSK